MDLHGHVCTGALFLFPCSLLVPCRLQGVFTFVGTLVPLSLDVNVVDLTLVDMTGDGSLDVVYALSFGYVVVMCRLSGFGPYVHENGTWVVCYWCMGLSPPLPL